MAVTKNSYTAASGSEQGPYSYSFPVIADTDIKVSVNGVVKTVTTHYTLDTGNTRITFVSGQFPTTGDSVIVYRDTDEDPITNTFVSGSTIRSNELNDNFKQLLYIAQESDNQSLSSLGGTMQGTLEIGEDQVIKFEGATANANETTLTVVDPTADRTITLPNVTGTVVTTGDTATVTATMMAANSVDSSELVDGSIDTSHIGDLQVTTAKLATDCVTAVKIAANAVNHEQIASDAVRTAEIQDSAVTTAKIANSQITQPKMAVNAVATTQIQDNAVTTAKINPDAITGAKIADNAIDSEHYVDGSIDNAHLANSSVNSAKIVDGTITGTDIGANAIDSNHYVDGSIDRVHLAADIVDGSKIADDSINSEHYVDGSIDTAHIADLQITTVKIAADAITNPKIANSSIDSNHYVHGSIDSAHLANSSVTTGKIDADAVNGGKIADDSINSEHYVDGSIDTAHIADNAVTTAKIADAELTTLAGMQSGTASILASGTALTSTTAELNLLDGKSIVTTIGGSATDVQLPTAQAVNERVVELVTEVGGFVPIANETSFPSTNPDINDGAGTIVSIKALASAIVCGSGVTTKTIANGAGSGNTVTINGLTQNTTYPAGRGMLVETTSTLHTYTYHRLTLDESGVADAQAAVDDFQARYRVASSAPSSSLDDGDLYFDTTVNKMKVYNASSSSWDDVAAPGDFYISTFSESFDGSRTAFTVSNAPTSAQQLIISINGVIQKPNAGTGQPSEGFTLSSSTVTFSSAPPSGSDYYVVVLGSSVNIGTPSDNTVATAKIQNLAVTTAKIAADAVDGTKIADDAVGAEHIEDLDADVKWLDAKKAIFGTGNDLEIYHDGSKSKITNTTGNFIIESSASAVIALKPHTNESGLITRANGATELYYDNSKKLETTSNGIEISGIAKLKAGNQLELDNGFNNKAAKIQNAEGSGTSDLRFFTGSTPAENFRITASGNAWLPNDNGKLMCGTGTDLQLYHNGTNSYIDNVTGVLHLRVNTNENALAAVPNAEVALYYDEAKKFETHSAGCKVSAGNLYLDRDDAKVVCGASDDLQIYHSSSSGNNIYQGDSHQFWNAAGNEPLAKFAATVELYHNNSRKFHTRSDGVNVIGDLDMTDADNYKINLGIGSDLQIYHNGSYNYIVGNSSSPAHIYIRPNSSEEAVCIENNGACKFAYDGNYKLETTSTGIFITKEIELEGTAVNDFESGRIRFTENANGFLGGYVHYDGSANYLHIGVHPSNDTTVGNDVNAISINRDSGAGINVELNYAGSKKFETDTDGVQVTGFLQAHGDLSDADWTSHDWHVLQSNAGNKASFVVEHSNNSQPYGMIIDFSDDNPDNHDRYYLNCTDSSTSRCKIYADGDIWNHDDSYTGSDETLKENIVDATSKIEDLKKLKVRNFNWKSNYFPEKSKTKQLGFIAQEVEQVFPSLVSEHDIAPGAGKDDNHTPVMKKAIKQAWAPILVKALQEAVAKIETLETKVAALEAK